MYNQQNTDQIIMADQEYLFIHDKTKVWNKGSFTSTVSVDVKFFQCFNDDAPFDGQNESETHFVFQCKFDGDRDGMCKRALNSKICYSCIRSIQHFLCVEISLKWTSRL